MWAEASPEHASRLIEQLLDDPAEARAMGARARAFMAENYSLKVMGRRCLGRLHAIGRA
jgi:glycosyltransferase involved in cell wall biosynthesis